MDAGSLVGLALALVALVPRRTRRGGVSLAPADSSAGGGGSGASSIAPGATVPGATATGAPGLFRAPDPYRPRIIRPGVAEALDTLRGPMLVAPAGASAAATVTLARRRRSRSTYAAGREVTRAGRDAYDGRRGYMTPMQRAAAEAAERNASTGAYRRGDDE